MLNLKMILLILVGGVVLGAGGIYVATQNKGEAIIENDVGGGYTNDTGEDTTVETQSTWDPGFGGDSLQANVSALIIINGVALNETQIASLTKLYGKAPVPGNYWYDNRSGFQGVVGQGTAVQLASGLNFGTLRRDASSGTTGVLVNGRELPQTELAFFVGLIGTINPGSYWLDANGNMGIEGNNTALVNLGAVIAARGGSSGGSGDNFWSSGQYSAGNSNADNSQGYVSVPGVGPVGYGF